MSGPASATSSRAAEAREEALVGREDVCNVLGLRGRVPGIELERAAEQDAVGTREHIARAAGVGVADRRLRFENGELAADRLEHGVPEELTAAEPRAIENEAFGQGGDVRRRREPPHLDLPPGD